MSDRDLMTVYYDGECPVCTAAAESWRHKANVDRLEIVALQDAPPLAGGPSDEDLRTAIHVRGKDGWLRGAKALLAVYRQLGNRPMATLLAVGIAFGVADPIYRLIARHRMQIPLPRRHHRI
jgi:predicted DCC family thiol-disulfide oxidoreductase YuxK